jgi:hypothetical protein
MRPILKKPVLPVSKLMPNIMVYQKKNQELIDFCEAMNEFIFKLRRRHLEEKLLDRLIICY